MIKIRPGAELGPLTLKHVSEIVSNNPLCDLLGLPMLHDLTKTPSRGPV